MYYNHPPSYGGHAYPPQPQRQNMTPGFVWVRSSGGEKVVGAVDVTGSDHGGMYIGRAHHQNDLIPGKVHRSHRVIYVPWGKSISIIIFSENILENSAHVAGWLH